jgi:hypothetical protein
MNERIKLLIEQATIKTSYQYHTWGDRIATKTKEVFDQEKFAELIIRECIQQVNKDHFGGNDSWDRSLDLAVINIKNHFGVE